MEKTKINDDDFYTGIGWLARENKISRDDNGYYRLDQTNLEDEIGFQAGLVWRILDVWGEADFETIRRLSNLEDNQVNSALGWLAREDKIFLDDKSRFSLK
jgi:hypothetical protein